MTGHSLLCMFAVSFAIGLLPACHAEKCKGGQAGSGPAVDLDLSAVSPVDADSGLDPLWYKSGAFDEIQLDVARAGQYQFVLDARDALNPRLQVVAL